MHIRQALGCKMFIVLITVLAVLAGCSRMNLAYRNLDLLIPWSLNDYLDMDRDQRQRFKTQLREHLRWHCRTQLPGYLDAVQRLQLQVQQGNLDEGVLRGYYEEAKQAIHAIAVEITPSTAQLLRELDDKQVRELNEALDKDRRERHEKYLEPPAPQQIRERTERMQERVEQWTGSINAAQRQRVSEWAQTLGSQSRLWLENRWQWQQAFREAVAERHEAGFEARIGRLLQERESFWSDEYRAAFARAEQAGIDLASDLYAMSDAEQRRRLNDRLQELRTDLGSLDCLGQTR